MSKLYSIKGGVHPEFHKQMSTQRAVKTPALPEQLVIPIRQTSVEVSDFDYLAQVGDYVYKGQLLISCEMSALHAPTSGTITAIETRAVAHPSGLESLCIILAVDGKDEWTQDLYSPYTDLNQLDITALLKRVAEAGIVGLGGAAFPSKLKLAAVVKTGLKHFIINAAECEPYITSDDMLLREYADEVIAGVALLQQVLQAQRCIIGIEGNKPEAILALQKALAHTGNHASNPVISEEVKTRIEITVIPTIYPSGDEKQLIRILTGIKIAPNHYAVDQGILVQNIATVHSIYHAVVKGRPLIARNVTVTGNGVVKPQNFYALIGTPFSHLIAAAGGYRKFAQRLLMGGPMMGFQLKSDQVPVVKATNCILVSSEDQLAYSDDLAMPCIRCGKCAEACPVDLLPQQLYWYTRSENHSRAEQHHLFNCIECGCCSYVCPSRIPLVQYYRHAKAQIREQKTLKDNAELARQRFEFREFRQQREKEERAAMRAAHKRKVQQKMSNNGDKKAAILAAMARAKAKKAALAKAKQSTDQNSTEQK